jgi:hypothetical protein
MLEILIDYSTVIIELLILTSVGYLIFNAYQKSIKPSKYMLAAQKLGFTGHDRCDGHGISMEEQQEALLRIFHVAGYFNLGNIWHDLSSIGDIKNLEQAFAEISAVVKYCNADQPNPKKFNAKYMRENLFKSDSIDVQDAVDLILYIGQHAYSRQIGQERCEIVSPDWIITCADEYAKAARSLRLIDRRHCSSTEYDGSWIAGAARVALAQRIIDYNYCILSRHIKVNGETLILAGEREIWANIDGMPPTAMEKLLTVSSNHGNIDSISLVPMTGDNVNVVNEGKSYMLHLAQFNNIKLNASDPFIQYQSKQECPPNRFPYRVYANYDTNETATLTETLMSYDLLRTFSNIKANDVFIIDTLAQAQKRPNSASTARDAAIRFVKRIIAGYYGEKKTFIILLHTNNPYIERQTLAVQCQVDQVLDEYGLTAKAYHIKIEGMGYSCQQPLAVVHSELGALIAEKWKCVARQEPASLALKPKRDIKNLLFQTRKSGHSTADHPKITTNSSSNWLKNVSTRIRTYF